MEKADYVRILSSKSDNIEDVKKMIGKVFEIEEVKGPDKILVGKYWFSLNELEKIENGHLISNLIKPTQTKVDLKKVGRPRIKHPELKSIYAEILGINSKILALSQHPGKDISISELFFKLGIISNKLHTETHKIFKILEDE